MEPVFEFRILTYTNNKVVLYNIIKKRRGHLLNEKSVEGTPFYELSGKVPILDSFGMEVDIRIQSQKTSLIQY